MSKSPEVKESTTEGQQSQNPSKPQKKPGVIRRSARGLKTFFFGPSEVAGVKMEGGMSALRKQVGGTTERIKGRGEFWRDQFSRDKERFRSARSEDFYTAAKRFGLGEVDLARIEEVLRRRTILFSFIFYFAFLSAILSFLYAGIFVVACNFCISLVFLSLKIRSAFRYEQTKLRELIPFGVFFQSRGVKGVLAYD